MLFLVEETCMRSVTYVKGWVVLYNVIGSLQYSAGISAILLCFSQFGKYSV